MAINWHEVTVGETEIVNPSNEKWLVVCRHKERVWLCRGYFFQTRDENSLERWTIDDPWEDVSEECSINEWGRVEHKGEIIDFKPNVYKRSKNGLRVWKRKEG